MFSQPLKLVYTNCSQDVVAQSLFLARFAGVFEYRGPSTPSSLQDWDSA